MTRPRPAILTRGVASLVVGVVAGAAVTPFLGPAARLLVTGLGG